MISQWPPFIPTRRIILCFFISDSILSQCRCVTPSLSAICGVVNDGVFLIISSIIFYLLPTLLPTSIPSNVGRFRLNTSHPPSVLRKAHAVCMASFNSPVVFFNSNVRLSPFEIIRFKSSIVIVMIIHIKLIFIFNFVPRTPRHNRLSFS